MRFGIEPNASEDTYRMETVLLGETFLFERKYCDKKKWLIIYCRIVKE